MILVFNLLLRNNPFQSLGMNGAKKKKKKKKNHLEWTLHAHMILLFLGGCKGQSGDSD